MTGSSVSSHPVRTSGGRRSGGRVVHTASAFLLRHAGDGVRIGDLTRMTGVSERALRNAFHREVGLSPKQFDLRERLQHARDALCHAGKASTVTHIANEHGFFELGRFAARYKRVFGESPSQTLRQHRADGTKIIRHG